jgi:thymidylate synthase
MKQYLDLLQDILDNGEEKDDRTGTGTISVFGRQIRFDLRSSFPAVTTKKLAWKAVVSELLWFIEGSGDEGRLREILYGDREAKTDHGVHKKTIWSDNANAPYWQPKAEYPGDLGRVYGVQWRNWKTFTKTNSVVANKDAYWPGEAKTVGHLPAYVQTRKVDQLYDLIEGLKNDPNGRRHIVVSYNPGELDQMALPPCHAMFQMYVSKNKLSCQMYQRSGDAFLGIPFNIASYALLTHMIAQVCNMEVGELILVFGDVHIYKNHIDQVNELLSREPMEAPALYLNPGVKDINSFTMADINLVNYKSHPALTAPMAV